MVFNAGSLPVDLKEIYSNSVGAQFGQDALDKTIFASFIGVGIIYLFMLGFYRLPGLVAIIALTTYIYLTLVAFNFISGVLTLPGLAALVLGVGMAVDANVLINERIKEELKNGRSVQQAIHEGYKGAFSSIVDANITTLITAVILYAVGTGSIKGFAITTAIGVATSMFTAIVGTRAIVNLLYGGKRINKLSI